MKHVRVVHRVEELTDRAVDTFADHPARRHLTSRSIGCGPPSLGVYSHATRTHSQVAALNGLITDVAHEPLAKLFDRLVGHDHFPPHGVRTGPATPASLSALMALATVAWAMSGFMPPLT